MSELKVTMKNSNINKTYQIISTLNGIDIIDKHNSFLNRHNAMYKRKKANVYFISTGYQNCIKITKSMVYKHLGVP